MLVDSHCHLDKLDLTAYQGSLDLALDAAKHQGVGYILCVCIDLQHFSNVIEIAEKYKHVFASVGLHPNEKVITEPTYEELIKLAQHEKVIGIGETGLDYYRSEGDLTWQQNRFRNHIAVAKYLKKPLIIHSRQARKDTIEILKQEKADEVGGVMHCFTEDWDMAQQAIDLNFYISFSGIVTFKNAIELKEVVKKVPLERMLIETDAPYLAPMPFRGKPNEPAYVRYVAEHIAELKNIKFEQVAQKTTENFFSAFNIAIDEYHN
jgi:TatD DNase family protein